jgi:DNA recombination protein RmuC
MDPILALIIGLIAGAILGVVIGVLLARVRGAAASDRVDPEILEARHQAIIAQVTADERAQQAQLSTELASITARAGALGEQVIALQQQYKETIDRHRDEAQALTERERRESKVLQALTPVQETLRTRLPSWSHSAACSTVS